jgi:hypothetical protein
MGNPGPGYKTVVLVADALDIYGGLSDEPSDLMKVVEVLAAAIKGQPTKSCQILDSLLPGRLKRFEKSVNHPRVFGHKARHAQTPSRVPDEPMTERECREFVRELLLRVAKELIRECTPNKRAIPTERPMRRDRSQPRPKPADGDAKANNGRHMEEMLDEALRETFPASDPLSIIRYPPEKQGS